MTTVAIMMVSVLGGAVGGIVAVEVRERIQLRRLACAAKARAEEMARTIERIFASRADCGCDTCASIRAAVDAERGN